MRTSKRFPRLAIRGLVTSSISRRADVYDRPAIDDSPSASRLGASSSLVVNANHAKDRLIQGLFVWVSLWLRQSILKPGRRNHYCHLRSEHAEDTSSSPHSERSLFVKDTLTLFTSIHGLGNLCLDKGATPESSHSSVRESGLWESSDSRTPTLTLSNDASPS